MTPISNDNYDEYPSKGVVTYRDLTAPGGPVMFHGTVDQIDQCLFSTLASGGLPINSLTGGGTPPAACTACDSNVISSLSNLGGIGLIAGYGAEVSYKSTNPSNPGSGTAYVCVASTGQGPNNAVADDWVAVVGKQGDGGPYANYQNLGPLSHGNIHVINCPAPQTGPNPLATATP